MAQAKPDTPPMMAERCALTNCIHGDGSTVAIGTGSAVAVDTTYQTRNAARLAAGQIPHTDAVISRCTVIADTSSRIET